MLEHEVEGFLLGAEKTANRVGIFCGEIAIHEMAIAWHIRTVYGLHDEPYLHVEAE
jgi:hypothetical protein